MRSHKLERKAHPILASSMRRRLPPKASRVYMKFDVNSEFITMKGSGDLSVAPRWNAPFVQWARNRSGSFWFLAKRFFGISNAIVKMDCLGSRVQHLSMVFVVPLEQFAIALLPQGWIACVHHLQDSCPRSLLKRALEIPFQTKSLFSNQARRLEDEMYRCGTGVASENPRLRSTSWPRVWTCSPSL